MAAGLLLLIGPFIVVISGASQTVQQVNSVPFSFMPQGEFFTNAQAAWQRANLGNALFNSIIMATLVTIGKVALSAFTAFAIVFFRSPLKHLFFWTVFITLMLPLEVRVVPTYSVAADLFQPFRSILGLFGIEVTLEWNLLNSYAGLTLPLIATATGTFLYRQFFMTIPDEPGGGRAHGRFGRGAFLRGHAATAVAHQHAGAHHHHVRLCLEPVSLASPDGHRPVLQDGDDVAPRAFARR